MHSEVPSNHWILSCQYTNVLRFYIPANADSILNLTLLSCSYRTPCRNYLVSFVLSYLILSYLYSRNVPDNLMPDTCSYLFVLPIPPFLITFVLSSVVTPYLIKIPCANASPAFTLIAALFFESLVIFIKICPSLSLK